MKFLVDAQLPVRLSYLLKSIGQDAIHTKELTLKNATSDTEINTISIREQRIVITKDSDFWDSFYISQEPYNNTSDSFKTLYHRSCIELVFWSLFKLPLAFEPTAN